jgi:predicted permease
MRLLDQARAPQPLPASHAKPSSVAGLIWNALADIRYGARAVKARPTFAAVVMLTLALGIGVNVAIFSLVQQVLLRPLPVPEPERLLNLSDAGSKLVGMASFPFASARPSASGGPDTDFSYPMFRDLERSQEPFVELAAHRFFEANLGTGDRARLATGAFVSGSYFSVLGLRPALGRLLGPEDDRVDGRAESVVLSHAYWQTDFSGDRNVLGRTLTVNGVPLRIVGVAPRGFAGTAVNARASAFVPISIEFPTDTSSVPAAFAIPHHRSRNNYWVHLFARLKPGITREEAAAAMNARYRTLLSDVETPLLTNVNEQQREAFRSRTLVLDPGPRGQSSSQLLLPARHSLELLSLVSGVVLFLCCANVAGLLLLRATTRGGEVAVRAAMGATRMRLGSLLLAESLVLALPAALLSLPVAWLTLRGASRVPGMSAAAPEVSLSATAAIAAIGIAVASALVVGLFPVRSLLRTKPGNALQAFGVRHTTTRAVARFRTALATAQVALSMGLLAMTGVFAQSLANIARLDLGIDIDSVLTFSLSPPPGAGTDRTLFQRVAEALKATPGVSSVATSVPAVLSLDEYVGRATIEGLADDLPFARNFVSPDFFRTFGVELVAGREFRDTDGPDRVAIVSRRFVERSRLAPDEIVGRRANLGALDIDTRAPILEEIIGVVGDVRSGKITDEIEPQVFQPGGGRTFYVRGARPPEDLLNAVRETVARVDPATAVTNLRTMEEQLHANVAIERFFAGTSTAFAMLATALAALGVYGVLAFSVALRSRELGLRIALGAPADRVRGMVLRQVAGMAVTGAVLGAAAAAVLGRAAQSILFGVEAGSPVALAAAAVVLAAVTFGAAYVPARRASRVDPMTVLRYE